MLFGPLRPASGSLNAELCLCLRKRLQKNPMFIRDGVSAIMDGFLVAPDR